MFLWDTFPRNTWLACPGEHSIKVLIPTVTLFRSETDCWLCSRLCKTLSVRRVWSVSSWKRRSHRYSRTPWIHSLASASFASVHLLKIALLAHPTANEMSHWDNGLFRTETKRCHVPNTPRSVPTHEKRLERFLAISVTIPAAFLHKNQSLFLLSQLKCVPCCIRYYLGQWMCGAVI